MHVELAKVPEPVGAVSETSWWPFLLGTAFTCFAAALPVSRPAALVALVLFLGTVIGWTWSDLARPPPDEGTVGGHGRVWWGVLLLIVSEAGLFLGGFLSLTAHGDIFGASAPAPFRELNRPTTFVASLVLWSSGFAGLWAMRSLERGERRRAIAGFALTISLGALFVGYQAFEYHRLVREGFTLASGGAGSIFYFLTGLHGLHVLGGLGALGTLLGLLLARKLSAPRMSAARAVMLYWHFVDAAWVAIYAVLYLKLV
ncbi:MAG: cytochrome c oxidase subunit 3 [Thermoplasmatota archaeon]